MVVRGALSPSAGLALLLLRRKVFQGIFTEPRLASWLAQRPPGWETTLSLANPDTAQSDVSPVQ